MHQCEVHQEMKVALHQSDVCACNNQQTPPYAHKFLFPTIQCAMSIIMKFYLFSAIK